MLGALESPIAAEVVIAGRRYVNFGGSAYLGLAANKAILKAGIDALRRYGPGMPAPRSQEVHSPAHREAEVESAASFNASSSMYFAAGYFFGLIAVGALRQRHSALFIDEFAHYSLKEAAAASGLDCHVYRHRCPDDLAQRMRRQAGPPLVLTDAVFPALGALAPLRQIADLVESRGGRLIVDESHSFGVIGARGAGACQAHGIADELVLRGGSLGKAFGTCGGTVVAAEGTLSACRRAPVAVGGSLGSPAAAAMTATALRYVRRHSELIERLRANTRYLKTALRGLGLQIEDSVAPIASFNPRGISLPKLKRQLMELGVFVYHIDYVGGPPGGVIRCGVFADHTQGHLDELLDGLRRLL